MRFFFKMWGAIAAILAMFFFIMLPPVCLLEIVTQLDLEPVWKLLSLLVAFVWATGTGALFFSLLAYIEDWK